MRLCVSGLSPQLPEPSGVLRLFTTQILNLRPVCAFRRETLGGGRSAARRGVCLFWRPRGRARESDVRGRRSRSKTEFSLFFHFSVFLVFWALKSPLSRVLLRGLTRGRAFKSSRLQSSRLPAQRVRGGPPTRRSSAPGTLRARVPFPASARFWPHILLVDSAVGRTQSTQGVCSFFSEPGALPGRPRRCRSPPEQPERLLKISLGAPRSARAQSPAGPGARPDTPRRTRASERRRQKSVSPIIS